MQLEDLETPCLVLDEARLSRNAEVMRTRCDALGVRLRPHVKTSKSIQVARVAGNGRPTPITVSTLKEAEHFARNGFDDVLYAAVITPNKFAHAKRIQTDTRCNLILVVDSLDMVLAAEAYARANGTIFSFLVEIDCGEHRSGVAAEDGAAAGIAAAIAASPGLRFRGVMTHAGHSYGSNELAAVRRIASAERDAALTAATAISKAVGPCEIVSVGSTPTVLHADHLDGITEARCGIYLFWDLAQLSRNMCSFDDLAVSVLGTVIGHNKGGRSIVLDTGALALSKDLGANALLPDAGFGYVCDVRGNRLAGLSVATVHQEHGTVPLPDETWFDRLPIGTPIRVLPNHACITCAGHDGYWVMADGAVRERWERINGW